MIYTAAAIRTLLSDLLPSGPEEDPAADLWESNLGTGPWGGTQEQVLGRTQAQVQEKVLGGLRIRLKNKSLGEPRNKFKNRFKNRSLEGGLRNRFKNWPLGRI